MAFIDFLIQKGIIDKREAEKITKETAVTHADVADLLLERGMSKEEVLDLKAEYLNVPPKSIDPQDVPTDVLKYIPEESAIHYQFIPIGFADGVLEVGIVDPDNIEARDALQFIASKLNIPYKIFLISSTDFETLLKSYKGLSGEVNNALSELEGELKRGETVSSATRRVRETLDQTLNLKDEKLGSKIVEDTPITKIVAVVLRH